MALIFTTKGDLDESLLIMTEGSDETDTETANWIEYHLDGELVKRDYQFVLPNYINKKEEVFTKKIVDMK